MFWEVLRGSHADFERPGLGLSQDQGDLGIDTAGAVALRLKESSPGSARLPSRYGHFGPGMPVLLGRRRP